MKPGENFPWWTAGLVAAALAMAVAGLRLPTAPKPAGAPARPPSLMLVSAEGKEILDPTQLFLPKRGRGEAGELPNSLRPGNPALGVEFSPVFWPDLRQLPGPAAAPASPVDGLALTERPDAPLALGRANGGFSPLPARLAAVEAVETGSGRVVWALVLPPTTDRDAPTGDWKPLELLGTVAPTGLVGGLVVARSSESTKVADYFRQKLAREVRVGERLLPGTYVFRVGP